MNKNKLLAIVFALVMAVVLSGAVAAADNNTSTTDQTNGQVQTTTNTALPDPLNTRTGISYTTIQDAIDSVFTHNGDTITVEAGTYNEDVLVWKSLHIIGEDPATTFVNSFYVNTAGSGSEIEGFTVTGGTGEAITLQDTTDVSIDGNVIFDGYSAGVAVVNSDNNEILDNIISDNFYGIYLDNSTGNSIDGNLILDSIFSGIWLLDSDDNTIGDNSANTISGNGKDGIVLENSNDNQILDNTITASSDDGIELIGSNGNTITDNAILDNLNGIVLDESNNNILGIQGSLISYNTIKGTGASVVDTYGIKITSSSGNVINSDIGQDGDNSKGFATGVYLSHAANTIMDVVSVWNCGRGIAILDLSNAVLHSPWVKNNVQDGIDVADSTVAIDNTGTGSSISGNGLVGIHAINSSVDIDNTLFDSNLSYGIYLWDSNDATVTDCAITNNYVGIYLYSSDYAEISDSNISDNNWDGIEVLDSNHILVDTNAITSNGDDGIWGSDSDFLEIEGNTVSSNPDDGIDLDSCDDFEVSDNTIENNADNGVEIDDSTGGEINDNIIGNNGVLFGGDGVILTNSPEIAIEDNEISTNDDDGIEIDNSDNVIVIQNTIVLNDYGVYIHGTSNDVNVNFNRIVNNPDMGLIASSTGDVDAILNWWGYNGAADVADQIDDSGLGELDYDPWIVLSITANPTVVGMGGTSTITADLLHDSNGVYHNPSNGLVPYDGAAFFATTLGTIADKNFSNGTATSTLTNLATPGTADVSSTVDAQTVHAFVTVNPAATIAQIIAASAIVKTYYELNHVLPANVAVGTTNVSMPQFLYLLVTATRNINVGNLNPINITPVNPAPAPSGTYTPGSLVKSSYLSVALNIQNFIIANGRAPNFAQTSLGKIPFSKLVYMYAKVINFYGINARLPNYVTI